MSTDPKPFWLKRVIALIFFGVPGACCAAIGGGALGAVLFGPERDNELGIISLLFLISPVLLLGGTCTTRRPLFLSAFLPMPVLMSAGYHLREYHHSGVWPLMLIGVAIPFIAFPIISLNYARRAKRL